MEYQPLLLLLVLAVSVCSLQSKCPSSEDILPCECGPNFYSDGISLECSNKKTTLDELKAALSHFSKDGEIARIQLINLALGTIPSNLFDGLAVKDLFIYKCEINFEDGEPPLKGLEDSLQYLTISSSLTEKDVPLNLKFGHLDHLKILQLEDNKITELDDDAFNGKFIDLRTIELSRNGIEKIGEKTFEDMNNLRRFELSGNNFGSLRRNMLPTSAGRLERINLNNNGLSDLPDDLFTSLPSLEYISLDKNEISTLDQSTWDNIIEQLPHIDLEDNPLQCDSGMEWLFEKKVTPDIFGTCAGPEGKKGLRFKRFLRIGKQ